MTRALICGIGGQDGTFLAQFLLRKGYTVWGTSRDAQLATFDNLKKIGVFENVTVLSMAPTDFRSVILAFEGSAPDEIYFLPGQSSVGLSFEQPAETLQSTVLGVLNALEAVRFLGRSVRFYNASSSECFGDLGRVSATEDSPFHPQSPYAVARASGHWLVANYRDAYGLHASNGILFNHESHLRPQRFVTQKIISAVRRIKQNSKERLKLGRLDIVRDWGWAPEYVEAMWLMLQQEKPDDYIIATGEAHSLEEFVSCAFSQLGLSWKDHVDIDKSLFRPSDILWSQGNPEKAALRLGWSSRSRMQDIIKKMLNES
jgi:GDPmannose 4,6-dehydratase